MTKWQKTLRFYFASQSLALWGGGFIVRAVTVSFCCTLSLDTNPFQLRKIWKPKICNFSVLSTDIPALTVLRWRRNKRIRLVCTPVASHFPHAGCLHVHAFCKDVDWSKPLYYLQPHYHTYHFWSKLAVWQDLSSRLSSTGTSLQTIHNRTAFLCPRHDSTTDNDNNTATTTTNNFPFHFHLWRVLLKRFFEPGGKFHDDINAHSILTFTFKLKNDHSPFMKKNNNQPPSQSTTTTNPLSQSTTPTTIKQQVQQPPSSGIPLPPQTLQEHDHHRRTHLEQVHVHRMRVSKYERNPQLLYIPCYVTITNAMTKQLVLKRTKVVACHA